MRALLNSMFGRSTPELGHTAWMFSGQVGVSLAAFVLTYVMANYVSDTVAGSYRYILAIYSSVSVFALIGLNTALTHSVSNGKTGSYFLAIKTRFTYSCGAAFIFFAYAGYVYFYQANTSLGIALLVVGLSFPLIETFSLYLPYLNGRADFKKSALFLLANRVCTMIFVVGAIFVENNLIVLISFYCLGQIVSVYLLHRLTLRASTINSEIDDGMIPYAKHVTLMSVIGAVTAQLDKYILFVFFGPIALAKFWFASVLPQEMNRGVSIVVSTFFPRFAVGTKAQNKRVARKLYLLSSIAMISLIGIYATVAPTLFAMFLPLHIDAIVMSTSLMCAYGFVPYYFVWQIFSAQKDVKIMYVLNTLEPIILVTLYLILVPLYGVWGVIATIFIKNLAFNLHGLYYVITSKS